MNYRIGWRRLVVLVLVIVLSGCASQGGMSDATGTLGAEQKNSPAKIYVEMGMAYMNDNRNAVAMQKLKKAIEVDDNYADAHNVIAILYQKLGESELAEKHFNRAVSLNPKDPFIRNARGSYNCRRGRYEAANTDFERALSNPLYSTPWVALTNAGLCVELQGKIDKAENYYRRALTANPRFAPALIQMAGISLKQEHNMSARAYLERYHGEAKPNAASLLLGIRIERSLHDAAKANEYRERLFKDFPDAPEIQSLNQMDRSR
ncbi:MAG: type IV pilus biogenesis/stability protein PilW [Candidatus Thiodiazotropha sp.]